MTIIKKQSKIEKIQKTYERWWLGKYIDYGYEIAGLKATGYIEKVEFIGNHIYGRVELVLDNGFRYYLSNGAFRPRKIDLKLKEPPKEE